MNAVIYAVLGLGALLVVISFLRSEHFLKSIFSSALQGIVGLLALNVAGAVTGVTLSVNPYTLGFTGLFGLPGTISLCLLDVILKQS